MALDEDLAGYPEGGVATVAAPPVVMPDQHATEEQITAAVGQLDAGQPVTALPRQSWDYNQQQAWIARMDEFDRQAKAARIARDQAARDAQLLDQMSRVAKSTKDIEVAMQQQDFQRFTQWVGSGGNPVEGLQRFPRAATTGLISAVNASKPAFTPTEVTLPSGQKAIREGRYGERLTPIVGTPELPGELVRVPAKNEKGEVIGYGFVTHPKTGGMAFKPVAEQTVVEKAEQRLLEDQIKQDQRALAEKQDMLAGTTRPSPTLTNQIAQLEKKIQANRAKLGGGVVNVPRGTKSVGVTGQGTREDPARPTTQEQFDSLKSGMYFINPKDGALRIVK